MWKFLKENPLRRETWYFFETKKKPSKRASCIFNIQIESKLNMLTNIELF